MTRPALGALREHVRAVPDHPRPGVTFRDLTPLFADALALRTTLEALAGHAREARAQYVLAAEARGFVLGGAVAGMTGAGFVLARKPGMLPCATDSVDYELEYGADSLEVHADALPAGARVLVHDDLLATGGTAHALCELVERAGARVAGCTFIVELSFLGGRARLVPHEVRSLIDYQA